MPATSMGGRVLWIGIGSRTQSVTVEVAAAGLETIQIITSATDLPEILEIEGWPTTIE